MSAHDLGRGHCRGCRERVITGKLVERQPAVPAAAAAGGAAGAGGGAAAAKKAGQRGERSVGQVLGKLNDKICTIM